MKFKEKMACDPSHLLSEVREAMHPLVGLALGRRELPWKHDAIILDAEPRSVQVRGAVRCVASTPGTSSVGLLLTRPFSR